MYFFRCKIVFRGCLTGRLTATADEQKAKSFFIVLHFWSDTMFDIVLNVEIMTKEVSQVPTFRIRCFLKGNLKIFRRQMPGLVFESSRLNDKLEWLVQQLMSHRNKEMPKFKNVKKNVKQDETCLDYFIFYFF